ncbi:MAG: hypothetical protein ABJG47_12460 [Ekhidna sp.]
MNYKPEESTLIAYLYGELTAEEQKKVEAYLSGNEEARKELDELSETLSIMGQVKDKEVDIPTFTFDQSSKIVVSGASAFGYWQKSLAIAASIALVLFIGYITRFNASYDGDGFQLAFGSQNEGYNQEQVESMIELAIAKNNNTLDQKFASTEAGMKEYVADNSQSLQTQFVSNMDKRSLSEADFEQQKRVYLSQLKQLVENSELAQKKYTDEVMTDFAIFLDIQRQNDLQVIQTRFNNLQDNAELNQFQTNQILANLISSVDGGSNQY